MKRIGMFFAGLAGLAATTLWAQSDIRRTGQLAMLEGPLPTAVPAQPIAQIANEPLTAAQQKVMAQRNAVRPGMYQFRSLHAGLCARAAGLGSNPPLALASCDRSLDPGLYGTFAILPHPVSGYTIRFNPMRYGFDGMRPFSSGEIGNCLGAARGVVFGAARVDLRACDNAGTDWTRVGADDQRFFLNKVGGNTWEVVFADLGDVPNCWVLRDGGRENNTEVIRWQCNRTPDQLWELVWVEPIPAGYETPLLDQTNWYRTPSGHFSILGAEGLELSGAAYTTFKTANDQGDYCRKRCAELDQCRTWTWTGPNYVINADRAPRCSWRSAIGDPMNRGQQSFADLRSGIVRP